MATLDVSSPSVTFINKVLEGYFVAGHYTSMSYCMPRLKGFLFLHGGAYLTRASVDLALGNDWGPKSSVADDYSLGIAANRQKVGFRCLRGWFTEAPTSNLAAYISHRARNYRGQLYSTYNIPMRKLQKLTHILHMVMPCAYPTCHVIMLGFLFAYSPCLTPAGPRCFLLDLVFSIGASLNALKLVVGASYLDLSNVETFACICITPLMVFIFIPLVEFSVLIWTFVGLFRDWQLGDFVYQMTKKGE